MKLALWSLVSLCVLSCSHLDKEKNNFKESVREPSSGGFSFTSPRYPVHKSGADDPRRSFAPEEPTPFMQTLQSLEQIEQMGQPSSGLIPGGLSLKFIIDVRTVEPKIYFINSRFSKTGVDPDASKYHYYFARTHLNATEGIEEFNRKNYFEPDVKKHTFIQGTLQTYEYEGKALYGVQLYPQDVLKEQGILTLMSTVAKATSKDLRPLAFVQQNLQQTVQTVGSQLDEIGVQKLSLEILIGNLSYVPMNEGITFGYLRVFPKDINDLSPKDIPFFDQIPLDLSVVAGVITMAVQDPGSHINLKSKERKTPNMVLRKGEFVDKLKAMNGQPIKLEVNKNGFNVTASAAREVDDFYLKKMKAVKPLKLTVDPKAQITDYDEMCKASPAACVASLNKFGGKGAKLGFLAHPRVLGVGSDEQKSLKYRITPYGFAVPLQNYLNFVNHPKNRELKKKLDQFISQESNANPPSGMARAASIRDLQEMFYKAYLPDEQLQTISMAIEKLKNQIATAYPGVKLKKVKVRSSANAEDIPEFDGAGLHSSFGAKLKLTSTSSDVCTTVSESDGEDQQDVETKQTMEPENLTCAIKGVYASLWNQRAVEERNGRRIDHKTVAMGLAVVPSYSFLKDQGMDETANSVIITRVINTTGTYGYTISTQVGENLATNPTPGTQAELCVATFLSDTDPIGQSYMRMARPTPQDPVRTAPILSKEKMEMVVKLTQKIEKQYCLAKKDYAPGRCSYVTYDIEKPRALDLEFKFLGPQHQIMAKQVREFSGK